MLREGERVALAGRQRREGLQDGLEVADAHLLLDETPEDLREERDGERARHDLTDERGRVRAQPVEQGLRLGDAQEARRVDAQRRERLLQHPLLGLAGTGAGGQALAGGRSSSDPIRLTLAGVAVTALCIGIGQAVALSDPERFDLVRNWRVGALSGATDAILPSVTLAWLVGTLLAFALAPRLDLLALGDDRAASLGVAVRPVRLGSLIAVVLLAGSAVAAVGPIAFIGLASPHIARRLGGIGAAAHLPLSGIIGAALVVIADTLGRIATPPAEVPVGIVAGLLGAPILILLARRRSANA